MSQDHMLDYYAARAAEYDRVYLKPERQADLRQIEAWLLVRFAGRSVLEVACGTGHWTRLIAPVAAQVRALDATHETLEIARRRVPAGSVDFVFGDAYALPPCNPPFDAAFAGFWWSHVPGTRLREFLRGLHACLAPGARVVFLDNRYVAGSSTPVSLPDEAGDTWQQRRLDDGSTHSVLKNFPTEAALRQAVDGLSTNAQFTTWDHYWALEYAVAA
jgi:demethylmenaquinone methyltransferase/2-methoxy-6-polyprenyl-1,4-benzoquinol methylase